MSSPVSHFHVRFIFTGDKKVASFTFLFHYLVERDREKRISLRLEKAGTLKIWSNFLEMAFSSCVISFFIFSSPFHLFEVCSLHGFAFCSLLFLVRGHSRLHFERIFTFIFPAPPFQQNCSLPSKGTGEKSGSRNRETDRSRHFNFEIFSGIFIARTGSSEGMRRRRRG